MYHNAIHTREEQTDIRREPRRDNRPCKKVLRRAQRHYSGQNGVPIVSRDCFTVVSKKAPNNISLSTKRRIQAIRTHPMSDYRDKVKSINKKYVPKSLSPSDKKKQVKSIIQGTDRPKVKATKRRSTYAVSFEKKFGYKITDKRVEKELISAEGIKQILNKGKGAYYSAGSRPNTTAQQWGYARLASVLVGGPARKVDQKIYDNYKK